MSAFVFGRGVKYALREEANTPLVVTLPAQIGVLTYTGEMLRPVWSGYDPAKLSIGGDVGATNAGEYETMFTPLDGYTWVDGTVETRCIPWVIEKAHGSVSLSVNEVYLSDEEPYAVIEVIRAGDGEITAVADNVNFAEVTVDSVYVTVTGKESGVAVVTVSVGEGTNHLAAESVTCNVTVTMTEVSAALNENEWDTIAAVAAAGKAQEYWSVGDRKKVHVEGTVGTLPVNADYYAVILDFNHDGNAGPIDFGLFQTEDGTNVALVSARHGVSGGGTNEYFSMNHVSSSTSLGGWRGCDLRFDVLGSTDVKGDDATGICAMHPMYGTLMSALPFELRFVMLPMTVWADNVGDGTYVEESGVSTSVDYLPLLSHKEVFGSAGTTNAYAAEKETQYAYFAESVNRKRYRHDSGGSTVWWLRSTDLYYGKGYYFAGVRIDGGSGAYAANQSNGIAPIFRVGKKEENS